MRRVPQMTQRSHAPSESVPHVGHTRLSHTSFFFLSANRVFPFTVTLSLPVMSRLIVKGLPTYITPESLKEHFLQAKGPGGTITDVKVAHKQDGTSRRFGFVGYKSEGEATKAKDWFDKTFLGTSRVRVDIVDVSLLHVVIRAHVFLISRRKFP